MNERIMTLLLGFNKRKLIKDALSETFFPLVTITDKNKIEADVYEWGTNPARFTDISGRVNVMSLDGFTTQEFIPSEISEAIPVNERAFDQLSAGSNPYTANELAKDLIVDETLADMLTRKLELIALNILFFEKVYENDGTKVRHDFQRDASLVKDADFSGDNNPLKVINDLVAKMHTQHFIPLDKIVCLAGNKALAKLSANAEVQKRMNSRVGVKYGLAEVRDTIKSTEGVNIADVYTLLGRALEWLASHTEIQRYLCR